MSLRRFHFLTSTVLFGAATTALAQVPTQQDGATPAPSAIGAAPVRFTIPLGDQPAGLPSGEQIVMPSEEVWKPICADQPALTVGDLVGMAADHAIQMSNPDEIILLDTTPGGIAGPGGGLNVVFSLAASVPAAAIPAFAAAEAYLESQFPSDSMTVTVSVSFASLGSGIIGGTGSTYGYVDWATSRSVLQSGADASDTIQSSLPSGSTIPVRYSSGSTTNETRIFWTFANWKASGGTVSGNDASMQFSTNFPFDYDPSNGVGGSTISLQDVIIHEVGHALGFGSGVDFRFQDIETLDIFRFRRTDGNGDFNPDTTAEFAVRPRWAVFNNPNDDVNFDIISVEYRLSDGSPWQASHFREQVPAIGIMDPAFSYGETFYPNFLRTSDLTAFDAIGYNK